MNKEYTDKLSKKESIARDTVDVDMSSDSVYNNVDVKSWKSFKTYNNLENKVVDSENGLRDIEATNKGSDEFNEGYFEFDQDESSLSRRNFLKIFGGVTALAGLNLAGCRRPEAFLVPYIEQPEWIIPGKSLLYATSMPHYSGAIPLVVTSHEGRPTYLKSNTLHPDSSKGLDVFSQASIYDLYQGDRSRGFLKNGKSISRNEGFLEIEKLRELLTDKKSAFLVNSTSSPSLKRIISKLRKKFKKAKWYVNDPINNDSIAKANKHVFGKGKFQVPDLKKARRILSLGSNFLGVETLSNEARNDFSISRRAEILKNGKLEKNDDMNRLYVMESSMSVTGATADHRFRVSPSEIALVVALLAKKVGIASSKIKEILSLFDVKSKRFEEINRWVGESIKDLINQKGKSLVLLDSKQSSDLHCIVSNINKKLGAYGKVINVLAQQKKEILDFDGDYYSLLDDVNEGKVNNLINLSSLDLCYRLPAEYDKAVILDKIDNFVSVSSQAGLEAKEANLHIPKSHFLESWGDTRSSDGTYGIVQPLISPIFGGFSELGLLLALESELSLVSKKEDKDTDKLFSLIGVNDKGDVDTQDYLFVKESFDKLGLEKKSSWGKALKVGFVEGSAFKKSSSSPKNKFLNISKDLKDFIKNSKNDLSGKSNSLQVQFVADNSILDGRYYNNTQLQEAPDPITKLTWDNAALVSLATAKKLGAYFGREGAFKDTGDTFSILKLTFFDGKEFGKKRVLNVPVIPTPGHDDGSLTISLGYGQKLFSASCSTKCNCCGDKKDDREKFGGGVNVYPYASNFNDDLRLFNVAKVELVEGESYKLALTQEHNTMEGRAIAREGTLDDYQDKVDDAIDHGNRVDGAFGQMQGMDTHIPENISIYKPKGLDGKPLINDKDHQWGMTIDLNSCIGCNSCLLACQSENNIPVVGKDQVIRGREMHWIRTDRYFAAPEGREDEPEVISQPVACQQCELAPCEVVCPVNATVHSPEGLNLMVYNRCIGTRYCANNCPYKVRRFNYFDFNKRPFNQLYKGPLGNKKDEREVEKLGKNPNVTVRMRGVMEKCTYCIQRIQTVKIDKKVEAKGTPDTQIKAGGVNVACQEACEFDAINFGNLLNKKEDINSELYKKSPRNYDLLKYLGVRPRTSFLARVKNPNPKMPYAEYVGQATINIH